MHPTPNPEAETVIARFLVKSGKEAEFESLLTESWQTYLRLGLIEEKPHLILRGQDREGKPYFLEFLTWKDRNIPMQPPAEVQKLWTQFHACCDRIEFQENLEILQAN